MTSTVLIVSRSPVGSSSKRISGEFARARAIALTRRRVIRRLIERRNSFTLVAAHLLTVRTVDGLVGLEGQPQPRVQVSRSGT